MSRLRTHLHVARLASVALVASIALAGFPRRAASPPTYVPGLDPAAWPTVDGTGGTRYSPLTDISVENVGYLEVAWSYRTGDVSTRAHGLTGTAFEATPVMVDSVLYVVTPFGRTIALQAETGQELWTFDPGLDRSDEGKAFVAARGLAVWKDPQRSQDQTCAVRVLSPVYDARLFALDAANGEPCPDFAGGAGLDLASGISGLEGRREHLRQTAPPTVIADLAVVGSTLVDALDARAPSGAVRAFDIRTGELRWAWEPLVAVARPPPDGEAPRVGAANTWATITADPERDLLFVPTGSPSPDHYGGLRAGDNRYANSVVALRGSTGEIVWHYQLVHHDLWDYDLPSPPALITLEREGGEIPAVVQTTKMGYVFVFHRETGEPLFPIEEVPVPASDVPGELISPTQPVPIRPPPLTPRGLEPEDAWGITPFDRAACRARIRSLRSDGIYTPPSLRGSIVNPGFIGGMEWGGSGFDPARQLLVTNTNRIAMVATLIPREILEAAEHHTSGSKFTVSEQRGTPYAVMREALLSPLGIPCSPPPWGMLHAVDLSTGELAWEVPLGKLTDLTRVPTPARWGSPNLGGPLVTGGLVFIGATMDRRFRAFDLSTGEVVWSTELPASAQASPITYRTRPGGRQFVVISAGGHDGLGSRLGDYVIAFALPKSDASGRVR